MAKTKSHKKTAGQWLALILGIFFFIPYLLVLLNKIPKLVILPTGSTLYLDKLFLVLVVLGVLGVFYFTLRKK